MAKKPLLRFVFVLAAVLTGLLFSVEPWKVWREQRTQTAKAVREMRDAERRHAEDLQTESRLSTSVGHEELARKQGFRKPGEVSSDGTP